MAKPQIKKVKKDSKGVTYYFSDDDCPYVLILMLSLALNLLFFRKDSVLQSGKVIPGFYSKM